MCCAHRRNRTLREAAQVDQEQERLRKEAFAQFDDKHKDDGEKVWAGSPGRTEGRSHLQPGLADLESALTLDASRADVREQLAWRSTSAQNADRDRQRQKRDDLLERMALYDATERYSSNKEPESAHHRQHADWGRWFGFSATSMKTWSQVSSPIKSLGARQCSNSRWSLAILLLTLSAPSGSSSLYARHRTKSPTHRSAPARSEVPRATSSFPRDAFCLATAKMKTCTKASLAPRAA